MWDHMQGYGVMGFGGFFGLLFWLLLIVGIVLAVKWLVGPANSGGKRPDALEILKRRYAGGEIGEEEYRRMKKELEGGE